VGTDCFLVALNLGAFDANAIVNAGTHASGADIIVGCSIPVVARGAVVLESSLTFAMRASEIDLARVGDFWANDFFRLKAGIRAAAFTAGANIKVGGLVFVVALGSVGLVLLVWALPMGTGDELGALVLGALDPDAKVDTCT
jgi:hypothetical protein